MDLFQFGGGGGTFKKGDRVEEATQIGLARIPGVLFVKTAGKKGLVLARRRNGRPLTTVGGRVRYFSPDHFKRASRVVRRRSRRRIH